jgi:hypothetical protein
VRAKSAHWLKVRSRRRAPDGERSAPSQELQLRLPGPEMRQVTPAAWAFWFGPAESAKCYWPKIT